jgi:hypothetical protein
VAQSIADRRSNQKIREFGLVGLFKYA